MTTALAAPLALLPLQTKHQAVAGLIWRPLPPKTDRRQAIRQLLQQYQGDQLIIHAQPEHTLCGIAPQLPPGQHYHSAALLLKAQLGDDWVAIFEYSADHYLLFGLQSGQVVPGCDGLFTSTTDVLAQFERYQLLCRWSRCYAPAKLNLGGEALELNDLLNSQTPLLYPLKMPYYTPKNQRLLAYAVTGMLVLGALPYCVWRYQERQRQLISLAQQRLQLAYQQQQQNKQQRAADQAWRRQPPARWLLTLCVQQLSRYPLQLGGWQLHSTHCNAEGSQALYQKTVTVASTETFLQAARSYDANYCPVITDQQAQVKQPLPPTPERTQEGLQPLSAIYQQFQQLLQRGACQGQLAPLAAKQQQGTFTLTAPHSPLPWLQAINLDGVVIQQIDSSISPQGDLHWSLQGTFYGN